MSVSPAGVGARSPHQRDITRAAILAAARQELREHGPACVGMRAIARAVGMPASSLYRFYADHAALMIELSVGAYTGLCAQLVIGRDAANPRDTRAQFRSMARAFRQWASTNPDEFGLLYNSPPPGEDSWEEPVFVERARAGSIVGAVVDKALSTGQLVPTTGGIEVTRETPGWVDGDGVPISSAAVQITLGGWAALVGQLCLEPRRSSMIKDPALHFEQYLDAVTAGMGFIPPTER